MIAGTVWRNEYGSLMQLRCSENGELHGLYRSTTGASGDYRVTGFIEPATLDEKRARALALGISWRAIGARDEDVGSHWVSGLSGQIVPTPQGHRMLLMHSLIVSTVDTAAASGTGFYVDKLHYEPVALPYRLPAPPSSPGTVDASNALAGTWVHVDDPPITLELAVMETGEIRGSLSEGAASGPAGGLCGHTDALAMDIARQSVCISGWSARQGCAWSLSGWLANGGTELHLLQLCSTPTGYGNRYLQTHAQSLRFKKPATRAISPTR